MGCKMDNREQAIESNMGLVHACAKRFRGRGIEYDDLVQAGCLGLVKAVDHFDEGRGLQFSTYAVPVILGEMRRLFRDGGAIKVGRALKELSLKAARACNEFSLREGRQPTISELAEQLGVEPAEASQALGAYRGSGGENFRVDRIKAGGGRAGSQRPQLNRYALFQKPDPNPDCRDAGDDPSAGFPTREKDSAGIKGQAFLISP